MRIPLFYLSKPFYRFNNVEFEEIVLTTYK